MAQQLSGFKKYILPGELKLLLDSFNARMDHMKIITQIGAFVGLRVSEIVRLRVQDFSEDFKLVTVQLSKTDGRKITRAVPSGLAEEIRQYIIRNKHMVHEEGYIFCSWNPSSVAAGHKHIQAKAVSTMFRKHCEKIGLNHVYHIGANGRKFHRVSFHTLRHHLVTGLMQQGARIEEASMIIGHKKLKTTMEYFYDPAIVGKEKDFSNALYEAYNDTTKNHREPIQPSCDGGEGTKQEVSELSFNTDGKEEAAQLYSGW